MSTLRSIELTRLPLQGSSEVLDDEQTKRRRAAHLTNLAVDVPVLNCLKASSLRVCTAISTGQLWMVVFLDEHQQGSLILPIDDGLRSGCDAYLDEVAAAQRQLAEVPWRRQAALSGSASPLDGTRDSAHASSTASVRQRVKRARRVVVGLPASGSFDNLPLGFEEVPSTLPQGPLVEITASLQQLSRGYATLARVDIASSSSHARELRLPKGVRPRLVRAGMFKEEAWGTRLQLSMDRETRIRCAAVAMLSWETGEVVGFELKEIL
jgi:hypothetical protein